MSMKASDRHSLNALAENSSCGSFFHHEASRRVVKDILETPCENS